MNGPIDAARHTTVVIIGGGQAGLATSHCLAEEGIDHVVLERGEVANSWRTQRWDSLRLLTPNWQNCLPGCRYQGSDPHGYMTMQQVTGFLVDYAKASRAPLQCQTEVTDVSRRDNGYRVTTNRGCWDCHAVVIASGPYNVPRLPGVAAGLPGHIESLTPYDYRNPAQLPEGGVLVVGASASGVQIADELQRSGRQVMLAVGEHVRMPRQYRGMDIEFWSNAVGLLDERWDEVEELQRARGLPSPQLVGRPERDNVDLNALSELGIELVGRVAGLRDGRLQFSGSLANVVRLADLKQQRLLNRIDEWIARDGSFEAFLPERPDATRLPERPRLALDLGSGEISTVVWATGFRPDYSWLNLPALDRKGRIVHSGGVTGLPGLYAMGLPFMRRRKSASIFGAGDDARDICAHLGAYLHDNYRSSMVSAA